MKLTEIIETQENLFAQIEEAGGEINELQDLQLAALSEDMLQKADNYGYYIVSLQKRIDGLKEFKCAVDAKRKAAEALLCRIKYHLGYIMSEKNIPAIKGNVVTIKNITKDEIVFIPEKVSSGDCNYHVSLTVSPSELNDLQACFQLEKVEKVPMEGGSYPSEKKYNVSFLGLKKLEVQAE